MISSRGLSVVLDLQEHGKHVGIHYHEAGNESFIHLANHLRLEKVSTPPTERINFLVHRSDEVPGRAKMLYSLIEKVADINFGEIPYSVPYNKHQEFGSNGEWAYKNPGEGLTCATFVLKAFAYAGIDLLDINGWPASNSNDFEYAKYVIEQFRGAAKHYAEAGQVELSKPYLDHAEAMEKNISGNWIRIRPTHVCASAKLYSGKPSTHQEIIPIVEDIDKQVSDYITQAQAEMDLCGASSQEN